MITPEQVAEIAPYWEEWTASESPDDAEAQRAKMIYLAECRKVFAAESVETQKKWSIQTYVAALIVPEILRYLGQRQSKYPTIQPEKPPEE